MTGEKEGKCGHCGAAPWTKGDMPPCDDSECTFPYWEPMTSENAAPAEMPGENDIHSLLLKAQRDFQAQRDAKLAAQGLWPDRSPAPLNVLAKVVAEYFAPILERATEAKYDAASQAIDAIERADAAEARALAAEAALKLVAEQDVTEIALDPDWPRRICAAAIRAQGE